MASIWRGSLSFGLVSIPVELRSALKSAERLSFRQLDKKNHKPIKYNRIASDGKTVAWKDIVKGYEISRNKFVIIDESDFKAVMPEQTRALEMSAFVPAESIDPRYFDSPYFLVPREGGDKAYALLRDALVESDKVGIGTFVMRQRQHLAAVKPMGNALVLEIMRFEHELVDPGELNFPTKSDAKVRPQERAMAVQLIENLSEEFDPSQYHDVYDEKLRAIIKAKAKGKTIEVPDDDDEPEDTQVLDLMGRLKASLEANKSGGAKVKKTARKTTRRRKSA